MEIDDKTLVNMFRLDPVLVPIKQITRCSKLLTSPVDRERLMRTITRRKPRHDEERRALLQLALKTGRGGVFFVDMLGGFDNQRPN